MYGICWWLTWLFSLSPSSGLFLSVGAELLSVLDENENGFVWEHIQSYQEQARGAWLGMTFNPKGNLHQAMSSICTNLSHNQSEYWLVYMASNFTFTAILFFPLYCMLVSLPDGFCSCLPLAVWLGGSLQWQDTSMVEFTNWEQQDGNLSMLSANSCFWVQSNTGLWKPGSCKNRTHGVICKRPRGTPHTVT